MSTLTELGDFFIENGVGDVDTVFLGSRPDSPDEIWAIYQYPGGAPEYVQDSHSPNVEHVQIQVVARAKRYEVADLMAARAWILLSPITNTVIGGTKYRSIRPNQSPSTMGRDTNDRLLVFFNASIEKEVSVVA